MYKLAYNFIVTFYNLLMHGIAPLYCASCRVFLYTQDVLCQACTVCIRPVVSVNVKLKAGYILTVHAVCGYTQPLRSLILAKNRADYAASKQLAQLMWQYSALKQINFDYLVPVPAHWTRSTWRGYNQAVVLAHELARLSGKPVAYCAKRKKRTRLQTALNAHQRQTNLENAFELITYKSEQYTNKVLVIVDDLMTTGSTLQELGNLLVQVKPKAIYALVACRVTQ